MNGTDAACGRDESSHRLFFKKLWRANESICKCVTVSDFGLNAACELMDNGNDFWRQNPASMFIVGQI